MEFIVADQDRKEIGRLPEGCSIDLALMQDANQKDGHNDMEITVPGSSQIQMGGYVFCPWTEYGGRVLDLSRVTSKADVVWMADCWRRMLGQQILMPPDGKAYLTVEGDANDVIRSLLDDKDGLFIIPDTASGISLSGQIDRHVSFLDGMTKILATRNARLQIRAVQGEPNEAFHVAVEAVPIVNYENEIEYSQDNRVTLTIRDNQRGINHLICLGSGELTERMVRHLYIQEDGSIGTVQYFAGIEKRSAIFDYPNAESESELINAGRKRLKELANYKRFEMSVQDLELDIGDIVACRDRLTDTYLAKPIIKKVLKVKGSRISIGYNVKGDD